MKGEVDSETTKTYINLVNMFPDERKEAIKNMTKDERLNIIHLLNLPSKTSQKTICSTLDTIADILHNQKLSELS